MLLPLGCYQATVMPLSKKSLELVGIYKISVSQFIGDISGNVPFIHLITSQV